MLFPGDVVCTLQGFVRVVAIWMTKRRRKAPAEEEEDLLSICDDRFVSDYDWAKTCFHLWWYICVGLFKQRPVVIWDDRFASSSVSCFCCSACIYTWKRASSCSCCPPITIPVTGLLWSLVGQREAKTVWFSSGSVSLMNALTDLCCSYCCLSLRVVWGLMRSAK